MILLGVLLLAAALTAFSFALGLVAVPDKRVRARLAPQGAMASSSSERRMRQVDTLDGAERYVISRGFFAKLERNLVLAGHPAGWTMKRMAVVKVVLPAVAMLMVSSFALGDVSIAVKVMSAVAVVVAYFVPDLLIHGRAVERQDQIQRELPDLLDKIVIAIEAGLGFESAMAKTSSSGQGPLADETTRTVQDIRLGMARRAAYEALQRRTSSEDLTSFIRGVIQAEEHGSSMSAMVRIQSKEMRVKRKLRAEAKAGKVSVKLLGPLMVCIFPVLFIVVLAPGIINAFTLF